LEQDEKIILENKFTKSKMKLILTNKRLIVEEKNKTSNISLEQIKATHGAVDSLTSYSSLILDMKDGEQIQITFEIISCGFSIPEESKKITDKYLTEINHQIKNFDQLFRN
jgi:hypothetical protein